MTINFVCYFITLIQRIAAPPNFIHRVDRTSHLLLGSPMFLILENIERVTFLNATSSGLHTCRIRHVVFIVSDYSHSVRAHLIKYKFHSDSIFQRTVTLENKLLRECFSKNYNLDPFKSRVKTYSSSKYSLTFPSLTLLFSNNSTLSDP